MVLSAEERNPFTVQTPEGMVAKDAVNLFVNVFTDFPKLLREGHVFLHGPRGSGKSMMFRYLQPDCQCLARTLNLNELSFFGVYVPIKNTDFRLTEFDRLENHHASYIINEHFMITHVIEKVFDTFSKVLINNKGPDALEETKKFFNDKFIPLLKTCGNIDDSLMKEDCRSIEQCLKLMQDICNRLYREFINYLKKLSFNSEPIPYSGPLFGYLDFLYPVLTELRKLSYMPKGPIYLLLDDADNLTLTQTKILNTWVSSRTSSDISIKLSTQLRYKTYQTISSNYIECPHDFSEINISTIYTASSKAKYKERISEIAGKRLKLAEIDSKPDGFFPEDVEQENQIDKIAEQYRNKWATEGKGYRAGDDAYRYARPDYIKSLGGTRKSTHTYRYAGFNQLVHISSGVIRNFLEAAALMYSEAYSRQSDPIQSIPPSIQDDIVRRLADEFMFNEFDKMREDKGDEATPASEIQKLYNLICALGGAFRKILLSDRSERRVFSIAISGRFDDDVRQILKIGSERGYFHMSSIGNKEGTGRTPLYVLSRRLAPHFNLDPSSFAGYLFLTSDALRNAMEHPESFVRKIKNGSLKELEVSQLEMFE